MQEEVSERCHIKLCMQFQNCKAILIEITYSDKCTRIYQSGKFAALCPPIFRCLCDTPDDQKYWLFEQMKLHLNYSRMCQIHQVQLLHTTAHCTPLIFGSTKCFPRWMISNNALLSLNNVSVYKFLYQKPMEENIIWSSLKNIPFWQARPWEFSN